LTQAFRPGLIGDAVAIVAVLQEPPAVGHASIPAVRSTPSERGIRMVILLDKSAVSMYR
jgi:hypothetical protein